MYRYQKWRHPDHSLKWNENLIDFAIDLIGKKQTLTLEEIINYIEIAINVLIMDTPIAKIVTNILDNPDSAINIAIECNILPQINAILSCQNCWHQMLYNATTR